MGEGVTVLGLGNWGTSLAAALQAQGRLAARLHASPKSRTWMAKRPHGLEAPILWLAVPDRAIAETAARIVNVRPDLTGQIVVHSSGAHDRSLLAMAAAAGAETASIHPMMSFPTRRAVPVGGVRFAVEAESAALARRLARLVRRLGGLPAPLASGSKALYHAGAMFGSPLLVATLAAGVRALCAAGRSEREALDLLLPMAATTLANVRHRGLKASFSGPIARGDAATVKVHRNAMAEHPLLARVYDALAALSVDPDGCGGLPCADRSAIQAALADARMGRVLAPARTASRTGTRQRTADRRR